MHTARKSSLVHILLLLSLAFWSTSRVFSADIAVDEDCSLSAAIIAANNDAVFDRCVAGDGTDTITLLNDVALSGRLPTITTDMTIDGGDYTVSGEDVGSIFFIDDAVVTLKNLTITKGLSGSRGAGIHVEYGDLRLESATVIDNHAGDAGGGIYASNSNVNIIASRIEDSTAGRSGGAGIYFTSSTAGHTLNIEELSVFRNNIASQDGGAVRVAGGIVTIDKSSFSENSADEGGVIEIWNGSLRVENTTMNENHAREGGAINAGADLDSAASVTLVHVSLVDNTAEERGASIALTGSQATLSVGNSYISGETDEGVTLCHPGISEYSVIEYVSNTIVDGSCPLVEPEEEEEEEEETVGQAARDNEIGDEELDAQSLDEADQQEQFSIELATPEAIVARAQNVEEVLEELKLGAPRTWRGVTYYPLEEGSSAIDTADETMCAELRDPDSDLVDTTRPQGDGCDIGAFELPWSDEPPPTPTPIPTATPTATPPEETPPQACRHIVQPGDSLYTVALQYGTTIEDLRLLNRLTIDLLDVGQELILPGCEPTLPEEPFICNDIPYDIFIKAASTDIRCEVVELSDLDKHPLMNAGINVAVEVWGRTNLGVEICFTGGGSLVFMDTGVSPTVVSRLSLYEAGDQKCARIDRNGTVVHVAALTEDTSIPLTECLLTTANVLRLRDEAGGSIIRALVPFRVTVPARARTASWFFVEFMGLDGWISADYVQTAGICE